MKTILKLGIDVGSTTIKMIVLDEQDEIVYRSYKRHKTNITEVFVSEIRTIQKQFPDSGFVTSITGSAGMGIAERTGITFSQEGVASVEVIKQKYPNTRTLIDLGGEDSKMVFFEPDKLPDIRMNGSCAGGTGAFIDQMADLMNISIEKIGELALKGTKTYPVASRCGVFAKTDIQSLISRNINSSDIALSILNAVALQSITTLARGCTIAPKILCIGGPLSFIPALRNIFVSMLNLSDDELILPENSEYFPALGCALQAKGSELDMQQLIQKINIKEINRTDVLPALFSDEAEYLQWKVKRNIKPLSRSELVANTYFEKEIKQLNGKNRQRLFLGIDSGSTTTKILVIDENENIVFNFYAPNQVNPLKKVSEGLGEFESQFGKHSLQNIESSCSTGYGE